MKTKNTFLGLALIGLIVGTAACSDDMAAQPGVDTPDTETAGNADDLQKQIDELTQQIEDLKNGKPGDLVPVGPMVPVGPIAQVDGVTMADIAGHWVATSHSVITNQGNLLDLLVTYNIGYDLEIKSDHSVIYTVIEKSTGKKNVLKGTVDIADGHTLTLTYGSLTKDTYTVSLPAVGAMKFAEVPGQGVESIQWKKAAPMIDPVLDPVNDPTY